MLMLSIEIQCYPVWGAVRHIGHKGLMKHLQGYDNQTIIRVTKSWHERIDFFWIYLNTYLLLSSVFRKKKKKMKTIEINGHEFSYNKHEFYMINRWVQIQILLLLIKGSYYFRIPVLLFIKHSFTYNSPTENQSQSYMEV